MARSERSPTTLRAAYERTRAALVSSARHLFANEGFADVSVSDIAATAGVTKGAVYHHFQTKEQVFAAVFEDVEAELQARSRQAARAARTPKGRLQLGFEAYLGAMLDPEIGRIAIIDAPSVLGPQGYQEVVRRYAHNDVSFTLGVALPEADPDEIELLASILLGGLVSAAQVIVSSDTAESARMHAGQAMGRLIESILGDITQDPTT